MKNKLKPSTQVQSSSGFTLIELLVGIILAALVLTPLLGFMVNIVDNDRREQAKAASEQEIQTALDYIAQDLEQAVYVYDADGLSRNSTTDSTTSGIKDQIPPIAKNSMNCNDTTTCVPVLVFWKREFNQQTVPVSGFTQNNDNFVYSLVAYYLIKDKNTNTTWSNAARIGRFEIKDGVINYFNSNSSYLNENEQQTQRSPGFKLFDLNLVGTLKQKMDRWTNGGDYTAKTDILIDYIDQSTAQELQPEDCQKILSRNSGQNQQAQRVPPDSTNTLGITSFYACVDATSNKNIVRVFLRGNALARINEGATYNSSQSAYFPSASIQVQAHGLLNAQ